ncbi:MAG TPA: hypothetical protein VJ951_03395 [Bacteroidales bacterium]|nr:hypothetical protein [Bacteroidales bacterium]
MKRLFITTMLIALAGVLGVNHTIAADDEGVESADLKVLSCGQLEGLIKQFTESYTDNVISFTALNMGTFNEELRLPGRVALVTKNELGAINLDAYKVSVVGREIFVPIMNAANPLLSQVKSHGLSPNEFATAYSAGNGIRWDEIVPEEDASGLNAYRVADASFENYMAAFLNKSGLELKGQVLSTCEDVLSTVSKDKYGIGFCKLSQLQQMESINESNLAVIPVDHDNNDKIDNFENYTGSVEDLARGVWIGKYPASLYSRIYAVYSPRFAGSDEIAFIKWILTDGQQYFDDFGYSALLANEQENMLAGLEQQSVTSPVTSETGSTKSSSLLLIAVFIIAGVILVYLVLRAFDSTEKSNDKGLIRHSHRPFSTDAASFPGGYYFDKSHIWAFMERDGNLSLGIDNFLPYITGKITKVQIKQPGERVKKGEKVISLMQNGKKLEINSPVSGTIRAVNEELLGNSVLLNISPYDEGWLYKVEPTNWQVEIKSFLINVKYAAWIKEEFTRLKDFMVTTIQPMSGKQVVLQDGGEIREALLEELGPEAWEEFQTGFLRNKQ